MSLWIKICGNTSLEDALLAADAGADAVGFVFAPSPRQVTAKEVEAITSHLPGSLEKIGVFVNSPAEEVESTVRTCGLSGVQMHFDVRSDATTRLRDRFGPDLRILRVLHYQAGFVEKAADLARDTNIDALLLDSRTAAAVGGTGIAFDWKSASTDLSSEAGSRPRIVVAGGLTPLNVAEAIASLHPWGVDVVTGVEASVGRKDPDKVRTFIACARAVAAVR